MKGLKNYLIFLILYIYIFILFLKGYYPANETGILFIGFFIFMTLAYKYVGVIISEELNARNKEIYGKFEAILEQNYETLKILKNVHDNLVAQKNIGRKTLLTYFIDFYSDVKRNFSTGNSDLTNHLISGYLVNTSVQELETAKNFTLLSYSLAVNQVLRNKSNNESA